MHAPTPSRFTPARKFLTTALTGAGALGLLGCGSEDSDSGASRDANPIPSAYAALEAGDYAAVPDLIERLDAAFEQRPDQGRLAFYAGTMRLWRATGAPRSLEQVLVDVLDAIDKLEQARSLRPDDPHVNAFLGIAQVTLGAGLGDEQRISAGRQVLAEGVQYYPPYVNGVRTQAFLVLPAQHQYFPEALDAMYATLAECGFDYEPGDDFSIAYPARAQQPTCSNAGVVDHVWEGIFLIYGDLFVKRGDARRARQLYETAKASPTFDAWPFGEELAERIARADERAALYLDGDPKNDPPTWLQGQSLCVGCHASKP
ncbi:MAG TPA: hypothetical protein VK524_18925 [Polyangiaceae bacterium]|nr:hypothetical protein [Polyangiaceae bacterium]